MAGIPPLPPEPKSKPDPKLTPEFRRKVELARATGAVDPEHVAGMIRKTTDDDLSVLVALDDLAVARPDLWKSTEALTDNSMSSVIRRASGK
jgi:hypothetical protein